MSKISFLASGTLARNLILRLLPPIVLLVVLDLLATWVITHKIEMADWQLEDIFWLMVTGQLVFIALCVWVVVRGVRSGMRAVNQLSDEIAQRSADDLGQLKLDGLPK